MMVPYEMARGREAERGSGPKRTDDLCLGSCRIRWSEGFSAIIWTTRLRFRQWALKLGLKAGIWALWLGFGP